MRRGFRLGELGHSEPIGLGLDLQEQASLGDDRDVLEAKGADREGDRG